MHTHEFLIDESDPEYRPTVMAALREHVDRMPQTAALFAPADAVDWRGQHAQTIHLMLHSMGSWPAPDVHIGKQARTKWINPGYAHAQKYADIETTCDCGTSYGYRRGENINTGPSEQNVHTEECSPASQRGAVATLTIRRLAWLRKAALLWVRQPVAAQRLGCTDTHASRLIRRAGGSYHDWYGRGKELAANTMMVLRHLDVPTQLIADAYGCSRQTVYSYKAHCDREYIADRAPSALQDARYTAP